MNILLESLTILPEMKYFLIYLFNWIIFHTFAAKNNLKTNEYEKVYYFDDLPFERGYK